MTLILLSVVGNLFVLNSLREREALLAITQNLVFSPLIVCWYWYLLSSSPRGRPCWRLLRTWKFSFGLFVHIDISQTGQLFSPLINYWYWYLMFWSPWERGRPCWRLHRICLCKTSHYFHLWLFFSLLVAQVTTSVSGWFIKYIFNIWSIYLDLACWSMVWIINMVSNNCIYIWVSFCRAGKMAV